MQNLGRALRGQHVSQLQTLLSAGSRSSSRLASGSCCSTSYSSSAASLQASQQYDYRHLSKLWLWPAAVAATMGCIDTAKADEVATIHPEEKSWQLLPLSTRQRTFFKYEKRIRDLSGPDKIFEYFATETKEDGSRFMRPENLLSSLVAVYPPEGSSVERAGYLPGERAPTSDKSPKMDSKFFQMFDVDGDGLISYSEYLLLITFLSIPVEDVRMIFEMFDSNNDGTMDITEFEEITENLRRQGKQTVPTRTGFKETAEDSNRGLFKHFFGEDGKKRMQLAHFDEFLRGLHDEIVRLEFTHYDFKNQGYMSGKDFARSVICSVHTNQIEEYLAKVDAMPPQLATAKVSYDDFKEFASLRKELHKLQVALEFYQKTTGKFALDDLKRAVQRVMKRDMSDAPLHIVFSLFDANRDGNLASGELVAVLRRRENNAFINMFGFDRDTRDCPAGFFPCLRHCWLKE
ncbi:hypothetical protein ABBQ38_007972 [Trebouxia sp. C0009 RCD-2024]